MKKNGEKPKGVITVYMTLTLMIIISLLTAIIASARDRSMRMRCENAMDMGMQSIFGEYNRALLDEFDLYFIDSSYGNTNGSSYYTAQHLKDYMQYNLNPAKDQFLPLSRDMFGLSVEDVKVEVESLATDSTYRVYKRQAVHYVKDIYGLSALESLQQAKDTYTQYGVGEYDVEAEKEKNNKKLKKAKNAKDENGNKIEFENPADKIESKRPGMLKLLLEEKEVSDRTADTQELIPNRQLKSGDGIVALSENIDSVAEDMLFQIYLMDKFSSYTKDKGREGLKYELEYILNGKNSDSKNLETTVSLLMATREAANCIHIFTDEQLKSQAKTVAGIICDFLCVPELADTLAYSICFAWSFAETCVDIRTLLDGGKVPMMKDYSTWVLKDLTSALSFKAHLKDGRNCKEGFDYNTYLGVFIMFKSDREKLERSLAMIENDMRHMKGNDHFQMDDCIEFLDVTVTIKSSYNRSYSIRRYFGYDDIPIMSF